MLDLETRRTENLSFSSLHKKYNLRLLHMRRSRSKAQHIKLDLTYKRRTGLHGNVVDKYVFYPH